ncbi:unnamed protein product [Symbiodinium sp. CCMP2592]|nr:unnamed protein product [Symbiodinium sp. CCMP2592]
MFRRKYRGQFCGPKSLAPFVASIVCTRASGGGYGASQPQRVKLRLRAPAGVEDAPEAKQPSSTVVLYSMSNPVIPSIHPLCLGTSCLMRSACSLCRCVFWGSRRSEQQVECSC